jgi:hypothetical protein
MKEDLLLTGGVKLKIKAMPFIRFSCVAAYDRRGEEAKQRAVQRLSIPTQKRCEE